MPKMTGSRLFAEMLQGYGVTYVFFVPTILMEALAEMDSLDIRKILTHGEKAAAYMADGYARASGRPGVCMAQHVGASNLAASRCDRHSDQSPGVLAENLDRRVTERKSLPRNHTEAHGIRTKHHYLRPGGSKMDSCIRKTRVYIYETSVISVCFRG